MADFDFLHPQTNEDGTVITLKDGWQLIPNRVAFRTRVGLSAEQYYRLSTAPTGGLLPTERILLLAAWEVNRTHYLPYCSVCGEIVEWDHRAGGTRTWVHVKGGFTHVPEQTSEPDSHNDHPDGLAYVVWSHGDVLAWCTNGGRWRLVPGDSQARHREMVHGLILGRDE